MILVQLVTATRTSMLNHLNILSMYTPVLIYITVLAHACAWEDKINCNRIDSYDTGTIGYSYKNINVKMISIFFHVHSCANLYYYISTCLCLGRNDQLQQDRLQP